MSTSLALQGYEALASVDGREERKRVAMLAAVCRDIDAAPRKVEAMIEAVKAHPTQLTYGTLRNAYYTYKAKGVSGLVDQRKVKRLSKPHEWAECYMSYCENHNRTNMGAWRAMMADLHAGKALPHGVGDWKACWRRERPTEAMPELCPEGWVPARARYTTLQRDAKRNPNYAFQLVASRRGRSAAQTYLLPVLRTRVGLEPGQVIEFDDVNVDCEIVMPGVGKVARPLMFVGYDIASGFRVCDASRPLYPDAETGKKSALKEREFRMMVAHLLTGVGFHVNGVRLVVEHGTTAIRAPLERRIKSIPVFGELVTVERSGILAEAVHAGMFKGDGGGNFRFKGYCEGAHKIEHSMRAMLPGQVGQDAEHRPESHAGLVRYDQRMMDAVRALPAEQRDLVRYNMLDWPTYGRLAAALSDRIADDPGHELEGWEGRTVVMWRTGDTDCWHPVRELDDMAPDRREAILAWLAGHPEHKASRRMTRREVWARGQSLLRRIPMIELPMLLDETDARMVTVRPNGTIGFQDQFYYGGDEVLFHAQCRDRNGFRCALVPGQSYALFGTPYHADAVIVDRESGKTVGVAPNYKRAPIYDREAIIRAAGAQNADLASKMMPVRGRHQQEAEARMALIGRNADVFAGRVAVPSAVGDGPVCELEDLTDGRVPERYEDGADGDAQDEALAMIEQCH